MQDCEAVNAIGLISASEVDVQIITLQLHGIVKTVEVINRGADIVDGCRGLSLCEAGAAAAEALWALTPWCDVTTTTDAIEAMSKTANRNLFLYIG